VADPALKGKRPNTSDIVDQFFVSADSDFFFSAISRVEGSSLEAMAFRADVQNTIEFGCANGISSIHICSSSFAKRHPQSAIEELYPVYSTW
jgi:predicted O-methyltransferase YrrM